MSWARRLAILGGLVLVLGAANYIILQKQRIVDAARLILLELRPVDPRSLMQGDYMDLAYADAVVRPGEGTAVPDTGVAVLALDADGAATFARIDDGSPLAADEIRLRYLAVSPSGEIDYGSTAFFFQEGHEKVYRGARYGELRVTQQGASVLVGLRDAAREPIRPP